ncbi:MAG: RloB domain-containing protein [Betaproteobacteria bacterium]|nr:RloB domain-containing protein [Betaproteobacteria bacterium]MDE2056593.1 RloB domain-containing protein [Betaproteobacteria bacterium]
MGADNQPKARQQGRDLRRKAASRKSADRILIVCEGSKTEPQYFEEIRQELRLPTAHIHVLGAINGNDPLSVVQYAENLFLYGDSHRSLAPRVFDQIWVVFDRDEHHTYHAALERVNQLNLSMKNDIKLKVPFEVVASIPCFEIWLLLHYEEVLAPLSRSVVYQRLRRHIPNYQKGNSDLWKLTNSHVQVAIERAIKLASLKGRSDDDGPYTDVSFFIDRLRNLTKQKI